MDDTRGEAVCACGAAATQHSPGGTRQAPVEEESRLASALCAPPSAPPRAPSAPSAPPLSAAPPLHVLAAATAACGELPTFGFEFEFIAGRRELCAYDEAALVDVAHVAMGVTGRRWGAHCQASGERTAHFDPRWFAGVSWEDEAGRTWAVRTEHLMVIHGGSGLGTGYELVSPPLADPLAAYEVAARLYGAHADTFGLTTPCSCGSQPARCGDPCGKVRYQRDRPHVRCGKDTPFGFAGPGLHVHVDGTGLCAGPAAYQTVHSPCRGLVNLILLHERHEHLIRRLFPITDVSAHQLSLGAAVPALMRTLGALPAARRTRGEVRHRHSNPGPWKLHAALNRRSKDLRLALAWSRWARPLRATCPSSSACRRRRCARRCAASARPRAHGYCRWSIDGGA